MTDPIKFTIHGQPYSKANSRQLMMIGGKPRNIKSKEALAYERDALLQIPAAARQRLSGNVRVIITIYYETELPDLDESLILDILQDRYTGTKKNGDRRLIQKGVYQNDRQVREKHIFHEIDKRNPRAEITVELLEGQQMDLVS